MKVLIFAKQNNSYFEEGAINDFEAGLKADRFDVEKLSTEEIDGSITAQLYDILTTPSVVVTTTDGQYIHSWTGQLPSLAELKYYLVV
jgi:methyl coenzyme M reductase alpha subunit